MSVFIGLVGSTSSIPLLAAPPGGTTSDPDRQGAEIGESKSENARLVVANVNAMKAAIALSDRLDENSILATHDALLRDTAPEYTGHWRNEQAWIGMLRHGGLTRNVTVPVSAGLLYDANAYYRALIEYRAGKADAIVTAVAEASFAAVQNGIDRLVDAEVLTQASAGRRSRIWQAPDILAALDSSVHGPDAAVAESRKTVSKLRNPLPR